MKIGKGMGNYEIKHKLGSSKPAVTCEQKQSMRSNSYLKGGKGRGRQSNRKHEHMQRLQII